MVPLWAGFAISYVLTQLPGYISPLLGQWSDSCTLSWGRRRPFIAFGQLAACAALYGMFAADNYWTLACCHGLYGLGNTISCTAYLAVLPELVPTEQRGAAAGWAAFINGSAHLAGYWVGVLVGDGRLSQAGAYCLLIGLNFAGERN